MRTTTSEVKTNKQKALDDIRCRGDAAEETFTELEERVPKTT